MHPELDTMHTEPHCLVTGKGNSGGSMGQQDPNQPAQAASRLRALNKVVDYCMTPGCR